MEGFGPDKMLLVLVVVLLLFGAKRLPEIGSSMGKGIREFKKGLSAINDPEPRNSVNDAASRREPPVEQREPPIESREPRRLLP